MTKFRQKGFNAFFGLFQDFTFFSIFLEFFKMFQDFLSGKILNVLCTIFVKNLNFDTSDSKLRTHFEDIGKIHSVKISKKINEKTRMELSMGFGFVTFMRRFWNVICRWRDAVNSLIFSERFIGRE